MSREPSSMQHITFTVGAMTIRAALPEAVFNDVLERIVWGGTMIEIDQESARIERRTLDLTEADLL